MNQTFKEYMRSLKGPDKQAVVIKVAKACNVNLDTVSNWMYSKSNPKPMNQDAISKAIGRPLSELFPKS